MRYPDPRMYGETRERKRGSEPYSEARNQLGFAALMYVILSPLIAGSVVAWVVTGDETALLAAAILTVAMPVYLLVACWLWVAFKVAEWING